jgi:hypothetical protein
MSRSLESIRIAKFVKPKCVHEVAMGPSHGPALMALGVTVVIDTPTERVQEHSILVADR